MDAGQVMTLIMALTGALQKALLGGVLDANTPIEISQLGDEYKDAIDEMKKALEDGE